MNVAVSFRIVRRAVDDGTPIDRDTPMADTGTIAVWFWCPGCDEAHAVNVGGDHPGPKWGWNESLEKPTFTPSILVRSEHGEARMPRVCHSFVTDGRIQFLGDCTHALANQTVELQEPPEWLRKDQDRGPHTA